MTIKDDDEYLHPAPEGMEGLWSDNLWFSFVDREADVHGINHIHVTNKGYARFSTCLAIDGIPMPWANKVPWHDIGKFDELTDGGRMIYQVVKPQEELRIQADNEKYGFDVTFTGRFRCLTMKTVSMGIRSNTPGYTGVTMSRVCCAKANLKCARDQDRGDGRSIVIRTEITPGPTASRMDPPGSTSARQTRRVPWVTIGPRCRRTTFI